jgi:hypothetical protein
VSSCSDVLVEPLGRSNTRVYAGETVWSDEACSDVMLESVSKVSDVLKLDWSDEAATIVDSAGDVDWGDDTGGGGGGCGIVTGDTAGLAGRVCVGEGRGEDVDTTGLIGRDVCIFIICLQSPYNTPTVSRIPPISSEMVTITEI